MVGDYVYFYESYDNYKKRWYAHDVVEENDAVFSERED